MCLRLCENKEGKMFCKKISKTCNKWETIRWTKSSKFKNEKNWGFGICFKTTFRGVDKNKASRSQLQYLQTKLLNEFLQNILPWHSISCCTVNTDYITKDSVFQYGSLARQYGLTCIYLSSASHRSWLSGWSLAWGHRLKRLVSFLLITGNDYVSSKIQASEFQEHVQ